MDIPKRTAHLWVARAFMPLWCLTVSASALSDYDRLWLPVVFCVLAAIAASSLLASLVVLFQCWRLTLPITVRKKSQPPAFSLRTGNMYSHWLLFSWLIEAGLLIAMAVVGRQEQDRTSLLLVLLSVMALLFCVRGYLMRFPPLWSTGASLMLILVCCLLGLPPALWATGMLGSSAVVLWVVSMSGMKELWDLSHTLRTQTYDHTMTPSDHPLHVLDRYPDEHE